VKQTIATLTAIDLFCGCGGFSLGLLQAGIEVVAGVDYEPMALATYFYNLGSDSCKWIGKMPAKKSVKMHYRDVWNPDGTPQHNEKTSWKRTVKAVICEDITMLTGWEILKHADVDHVDVIVGSPPCESFSSLAHLQHSYDPRDELAFEMARVIHELQPTFTVMENVPYFAKKRLRDGRRIMDVFNQIVNFGYEAKFDHFCQLPTAAGKEAPRTQPEIGGLSKLDEWIK
jgi:DNA (cytosine-5)-methyltransferase 1